MAKQTTTNPTEQPTATTEAVDNRSRDQEASVIDLKNLLDSYKTENDNLRRELERVAELKGLDLLMTVHELCWVFARTTKCHAQRLAVKTLDQVRDAIGREKAEAIERKWRG